MGKFIYALLGLATLVAVSLTVVLVRKTLKRPEPPLAVATPVPCGDLAEVPRAGRPLASAAPLLLATEGATVRIDGAPPGAQLAAGQHVVEALAFDAVPTTLTLQVDAYHPVLLDARVSSGAVTLLVLGARCVSCAPAQAALDLDARPGASGDQAGLARALAGGDWALAAAQVRALGPAARKKEETTRLLAVLWALAARPTLARVQIGRLPRQHPLRALLEKFDAEEDRVPARQLENATASWNATSEHFERLTDRFVPDAPVLLTELTRTFDRLSGRFVQAQADRDLGACEAIIDEAGGAVREAVVKLRALRPGDCAWQDRVSAAADNSY